MARAWQRGRRRRRRVRPRALATEWERGQRLVVRRRTHQRNGRLELLQLLYGNRRILLEETGGASAGVAAGLGDHGGVAEGRGATGSRAERDRQGVRELSEIAAGSGQTVEESSVLHRRGAGGRRRT